MPDTTKHLLLVEDEAPLRQAIAEQLSDRGYHVEQAESGEAAIARLADFAFDIIITDLRLPGVDGSAVIEAAVARYPDIIAIVVTGYGTVKDAVEAIKRGASDFVSKPFQIDELLHVLGSSLEQRRLKSENAYLRSQLEERYRFEGVVGKSRPMARLFQLLETVAPTNSTILITGETGTGKGSRGESDSPQRTAAHASVRRAELQRHPRDTARGRVVRPRAWRVHRLPSGTVRDASSRRTRGRCFSTKVGTMSAALQMKLLRVLQEREFERVGDSHTTKVDVRVIAATNSDLARMVAEGQFARTCSTG
jgi:DNA-binding NtrC family response regulator